MVYAPAESLGTTPISLLPLYVLCEFIWKTDYDVVSSWFLCFSSYHVPLIHLTPENLKYIFTLFTQVTWEYVETRKNKKINYLEVSDEVIAFDLSVKPSVAFIILGSFFIHKQMLFGQIRVNFSFIARDERYLYASLS